MDELNGSELGTKEYWDKSYEQEIKNYKNHNDLGEVWFGEDSQIRITNWIMKRDDINEHSKIIDLGCGNGMFLIELSREGYKNLLGIDYSLKAVELSSKIAKDQNLPIKYCVADLLNNETLNEFDKFDIVHDKGTYDAISLHPQNPKDKRELYIKSANKLLKKSGYFIITSCNWTEDELLNAFKGTFEKLNTIPTPTFMFGGKIGNVVTSIVFKKPLS